MNAAYVHAIWSLQCGERRRWEGPGLGDCGARGRAECPAVFSSRTPTPSPLLRTAGCLPRSRVHPTCVATQFSLLLCGVCRGAVGGWRAGPRRSRGGGGACWLLCRQAVSPLLPPPPPTTHPCLASVGPQVVKRFESGKFNLADDVFIHEYARALLALGRISDSERSEVCACACVPLCALVWASRRPARACFRPAHPLTVGFFATVCLAHPSCSSLLRRGVRHCAAGIH